MNSVSKKAQIGKNVIIGEFTVIKDDVIIGNNVEISSNVLIDNGARIADNVKIFHGSVVSTIPQDLKFAGEYSTFELGEGTIVREFATLNRGTLQRGKTVVGKNCLLMCFTHVAHDCIVGNNVILANSVNLGGHVEVDDFAIVGGVLPVHQFVKIGKHVMIGAAFRVTKDVPPYILAGGVPLRYEGVNSIGLRRRGFTNEQINKIKSIYEIIYFSEYNVSDAVRKIKDDFEQDEIIKTIIDFIGASNRGIIRV
jgi:UDP-N-acetylglucosamine acyltransferase